MWSYCKCKKGCRQGGRRCKIPDAVSEDDIVVGRRVRRQRRKKGYGVGGEVKGDSGPEVGGRDVGLGFSECFGGP